MTTWTQADLDAYEARAAGWRGTGGARSGPTGKHQAGPANKANSSKGKTPIAPGSGPTHKYSAIATDGPDGSGGTRRYQSKKGARLAQRLEAERQAGGIVAWTPEVSIVVGTMGTRAVRHLVDALVVLEARSDGSFVGRFVEGKGYRVRQGERKRRALETLLGVKVEVA